ncbi:uncharacterized protein EAF01_004246 [Botrytis porri]|uniref:C3H1-type domain-containing protein n=1 Tax=Botrytis porri TaxID=87229 RepID=A0A4Z1KEQ6_9HELO|nr:uncharacterized protein EAF01_004246 [Botrytis porri]KAF7908491.1 hypothetical protein EAF01_004246 [Botrytis porri]TGO83928.1 hypothetical protein BPOR_0573g00010 [Botrytis porri]
MVSLEVFQEQFLKLKEVEEGKDQLIGKLFARINELESGLTETKLHLEREQDTAKLYQSKLSDVQGNLARIEERIDSNSYVSVLIDGDCMTFCDEFIKSSQQGGLETVHRLRTKVCEYLSTELELPSQISIRIRVYANKKGLASAYSHNKILGNADDFGMFVRGFNMGHPMCDFVDAGDGKECADSKLKECFTHDMADVQCRAVIFGGSADNGYARILQPYVGNIARSNRIVLLEGPPFAKELATMKEKFLVARFPGVFRNTKLSVRRVSLPTTPPRSSTPDTPSYAARVLGNVGSDAVSIEESSDSSVAVPVRSKYAVLRNSKGQRLDAIISPPSSLITVMRNTKHCNMFHILGECPYEKCNFLHGKRLDKKGIDARRFISRFKPCPSKLNCGDEKCLLGHQCPDKGCARIGKGCKFNKEMHNVDRS